MITVENIAKRLVSLALASTLTITGIPVLNAAVKSSRISTLKNKLNDSNNAQTTYVMMLQKTLDEAPISNDERRLIEERLIPIIEKYYDKLDYDTLTNILYALDTTKVQKNAKLKATVNGRFTTNSYVNALGDNGAIQTKPGVQLQTCVHEWSHAVSSWDSDLNIYEEVTAAFISNHSYPNVQNLFMMLGDLGDKEVLLQCLLNSDGDKYFTYLQKCFPDDTSTITELRNKIFYWFQLYYHPPQTNQPELLAKELDTTTRKILAIIDKLHYQKYHCEINDDILYMILSFNFVFQYEGLELFTTYNYCLTDDYSFYDTARHSIITINNQNRFNTPKKYYIKNNILSSNEPKT